MKKTLIAIAALAATSAFAQSTVNITGNLDFAGAKVGGTQALAHGSTFSNTVGVASTSVINFTAIEDLGNGNKATVHYGLDPRTLANDSFAVTNNTSANAAGSAQTNTATGLARDEMFVGIQGAFGNVRLGSPNSIGLNSFQAAAPMGTGIGSGYTGGGTATTMTNSVLQTRYSRSARWDSPEIAGFTASVLVAPGNDQAAYIASSVSTALLIPNNRKGTEYGLRYQNGPLVISYANVAQASQANATGYYSAAAYTAAQTLAKTSVNMLNANYNFGATTVYAGMNKGDRLAGFAAANGDAVSTKGTRYAVKHTIGQIDLMATVTTQTSSSNGTYNAQTDLKAKVTGARADYNLSKTAAVYAGYEKYDTGTAYANSLTTGTRTMASVGLKKSF